jgi:uncharacterized protein YcfJ
MAMRRIESGFLGVAVACVLAGCTQSSPPQSTTASASEPAFAPAPGQNASLADLLAPATAQEPAAIQAASPSAGPQTVARPAPAGDIEYARVVSVQKIAGPQQICTDETVVERRKPKDEHRVAGTVIGAIAGGVIGNQIGGGRGRTVATVGGAVAGGAIGNKVQGDQQSRDTVTRVVKHCRR